MASEESMADENTISTTASSHTHQVSPAIEVTTGIPITPIEEPHPDVLAVMQDEQEDAAAP